MMGSILSILKTSSSKSDGEQIDAVFQNDLLLDLILTKVLLKPKNDRKQNVTFSLEQARALRQVCGRWMLTVSSLFLLAREPLVHLDPFRWKNTSLESLIKGFNSSILRHNSLPPFSLYIPNHQELGKFFGPLFVHMNGAASLVQLQFGEIEFLPTELPHLPSKLRFPKLQKFTLEYSDFFISRAKDNVRFSAFIQSILCRTEELQEFSYGIDPENKSRPQFVHRHVFPQTLTHLQTFIRTADDSRPTQLMLSPLQPPLHQLTSATILGCRFGRTLQKFLAAYCLSLEHLCLECEWERYKQCRINLSKLPVFPRLKSFRLQGRLPVRMGDEVAVGKPKCPAAESLSLLLADQAPSNGIWTPLLLDAMIQIQSDFPCVAHLSVVINFDSRVGLWNVFRVMGDQLKSLAIEFKEGYVYNSRWGPPDIPLLRKSDWDALFLGTTPEIVKRHRWRWKKLRKLLKQEDHLQHSIRNLKNLKQLTVTGEHRHWNRFKTGLLSELSFWLGFLEMPQLKHLRLEGSFVVSKKLENLWRNKSSGRTIENHV